LYLKNWIFSLLSIFLLVRDADAQQVRLEGQIIDVDEFTQDGALRTLCPGCTIGGTVTIDAELITPDCGTASSSNTCTHGRYAMGPGSPNRLTMTVGDRTWSVSHGVVSVLGNPHLGKTTFDFGGGTITMRSIPPQSRVDPIRLGMLPGIHFANGRLVSGVSQSLPMPASRNDHRPGIVRGRFSLSTCERAAGFLTAQELVCVSQVGDVSFALRSFTTGGAPASVPARPSLVVFVGGAGDARSGLMASVERAWTAPSGVTKRYFSHDAHGAIRGEVERFMAAHPDGAVALIGHSWGGHTVVKVAEALAGRIRIPLLVTLDPVPHGSAGNPSAPRPRRREPSTGQPPPAKPASVVTWLNVWPGKPRGPSEQCRNGERLASAGENSRPWGDIPGLEPLHAGRDHCDVSGMFAHPAVQGALEALLRAGSAR
jgi:pimeloyl-ACP methyl ester carboxylesterase